MMETGNKRLLETTISGLRQIGRFNKQRSNSIVNAKGQRPGKIMRAQFKTAKVQSPNVVKVKKKGC